MSDTLTDSPSLVMQRYLTGENLFSLPSSSSDWPLYVASFPDTDNDAGCIYDEQPQKDGRSMTDGELDLHYRLTLVIRASSYADGWTKAMDILQNISSVLRQSISLGAVNYLIQSITTDGINFTGVEEGTKRRYLFEIPILTVITEV